MKRLPSLALAGGEIQSPMARDKGAAPTAIIRDRAGVLGRQYGARNTPQYAIIDPQGVLRYAADC